MACTGAIQQAGNSSSPPRKDKLTSLQPRTRRMRRSCAVSSISSLHNSAQLCCASDSATITGPKIPQVPGAIKQVLLERMTLPRRALQLARPSSSRSLPSEGAGQDLGAGAFTRTFYVNSIQPKQQFLTLNRSSLARCCRGIPHLFMSTSLGVRLLLFGFLSLTGSLGTRVAFAAKCDPSSATLHRPCCFFMCCKYSQATQDTHSRVFAFTFHNFCQRE